jgi:hypothetical protein
LKPVRLARHTYRSVLSSVVILPNADLFPPVICRSSVLSSLLKRYLFWSLAGASEQHPSSHVSALREPSTPRPRNRPSQAFAYIRAINLQALAELNVSAIDRLCQKRLVFEKRLALDQGQLPTRGVGTAAEGLLYSDAAFANAVMGTKGGTLD